MKKNYESPEVSIVLFESDDIITTSSLANKAGTEGYSFNEITSNFSDWE